VALAEDEQMIETLAPHAAEEPLAGGVGARGADGRAQHPDAACGGEVVEARPILAVVVADEEARGCTERCRLAQLLGQPGVGRVARHADVDDTPRAVRDDEEGEQRPEEEVGDRQEVARPDLEGVVAQERGPRLAL
jgi:hypothetical protein